VLDRNHPKEVDGPAFAMLLRILTAAHMKAGWALAGLILLQFLVGRHQRSLSPVAFQVLIVVGRDALARRSSLATRSS
jgi:hypothetical protein